MSQRFSTTDQVEYLQDFLNRLWGAAHDYIGNKAISRVIGDLPRLFFPVSGQSVFFDQNPSITIEHDQVIVQVPAGDNRHYLRFDIEFLDQGIAVLASFNARLALNEAADPDIEPDVNVGLNLPIGLDLLSGGTGELIEEISGQVFAGDAEGTLQEWFGSLSTMRYAHNARFEPHGAALERMMDPGSQLGDSTGANNTYDWIDIVLVADGFSQDDITTVDASGSTEFVRQTDEVLRVLCDPARLDNDRIRAIAPAIRFWRLALEGTDPGEHVSATTELPGSNEKKSSLGNLARLAEIGLRTNEVLTVDRQQPLNNEPIVVVLKRIAAAQQVTAISLGDLIIQPIRPGVSAATDAGGVLIHELGHTIGKLADEYLGSDPEPFYFGTEPAALNVSKSPLPAVGLTAGHRWRAWANSGPKAKPADPNYQVVAGAVHVGAYECSAGIYRPASMCKMKQSKQAVPFCPVCEEQMAAGLVTRSGLLNNDRRPPLTLQIEYLSPWRAQPAFYTVSAPYGAGGQVIELPVAPVYKDSPFDTTTVRVTCARTVVPDAVLELQQLPEEPQQVSEIVVSPGSIVHAIVRPDPTSPLPDSLKYSIEQRAVLSFSQAPNIKLDPPIDLEQVPTVPANVSPVAGSGGSSRFPLRLSASKNITSANAGQRTTTVFELQSTTSNTSTFVRKWDLDDEPYQHVVQPSSLATGTFRWQVFTELRHTDIRSYAVELPLAGGNHHFAVGAPSAEPFTQLPAPLDVVVAASMVEPGDNLQDILGDDVLPVSLATPEWTTSFTVGNGLAEWSGPDVKPRPRPADPVLRGVVGRPSAPVEYPGGGTVSGWRASTPPAERRRPASRTWASRPRAVGVRRTIVDQVRKPFGHPLFPDAILYAETDDVIGFSISADSIDDVTITARGFHPVGALMRFQFDFENLDVPFGEPHPVSTKEVAPVEPEVSFITFGQVSMGDSGIPYHLNKSAFKVRARTIDNDGRTSPWLVVDPVLVSLAG